MKCLLVLATLFVLFVPGTVEGGLRGAPSIISIQIDPDDVDSIYILTDGYYCCEAVVSHDGGETFSPIASDEIPEGLSEDLHHGSRRYLRVPHQESSDEYYWMLLRSDDDGITWTQTSFLAFIREEYNNATDQEIEEFAAHYEHFRPDRTWAWHIAFSIAAILHIFLIVYILHRRGWSEVATIAFRAAFMLLIVWAFVSLIGHEITKLYHEQLYDRLRQPWPPSEGLTPFAFIAAKPWALIPYLLFMWPILPGSSEILQQTAGDSIKRQRRRHWFVLIAGVAFIAAHPIICWAACEFLRY
jgi:hypothetical protein